jgi:hypothetical protein
MAADRPFHNCGDSKTNWNPLNGCPRPPKAAVPRTSFHADTTASGKQAGLADGKRSSHSLSSGVAVRAHLGE